MNFVSGMPILLGFALTTGGAQAAFCNWTMMGGPSLLAEIAAAFPTAGCIYYWSLWEPQTRQYQMRALLVLANSLVELGRLQIQYPNASIFSERWFLFLCTTAGFLVAVVPNTLDQRVLRWYFRITACFACLLFMIYWIWFPIASRDHLQPTSGSLATSTAGLLGFCSRLGSSTATTHPPIWQKRPTRQVRSLQKACGQAHWPPGYYPYQRSSSSYLHTQFRRHRQRNLCQQLRRIVPPSPWPERGDDCTHPLLAG
jgi:hypothetical protein